MQQFTLCQDQTIETLNDRVVKCNVYQIGDSNYGIVSLPDKRRGRWLGFVLRVGDARWFAALEKDFQRCVNQNLTTEPLPGRRVLIHQHGWNLRLEEISAAEIASHYDPSKGICLRSRAYNGFVEQRDRASFLVLADSELPWLKYEPIVHHCAACGKELVHDSDAELVGYWRELSYLLFCKKTPECQWSYERQRFGDIAYRYSDSGNDVVAYYKGERYLYSFPISTSVTWSEKQRKRIEELLIPLSFAKQPYIHLSKGHNQYFDPDGRLTGKIHYGFGDGRQEFATSNNDLEGLLQQMLDVLSRKTE